MPGSGTAPDEYRLLLCVPLPASLARFSETFVHASRLKASLAQAVDGQFVGAC